VQQRSALATDALQRSEWINKWINKTTWAFCVNLTGPGPASSWRVIRSEWQIRGNFLTV